MSKGEVKSERLREMERLYIQRAWSDIELGERFGVSRFTIRRDRLRLECKVPFLKDKAGRWYIDKKRYLSEIRVHLHEALAIYLASRRASRQVGIAHPHLASGLEKLAIALHQPMTQQLVQSAETLLSQRTDPDKISVMEVITRAWAEQIKVSVVYRALNADHPKTHLVTPYLIEPSHWSDSVYLIGHSDLVDDELPFNIARIEKATLTSETFQLPTEFDEQDLLRHAWGIWYSKGKPEPVVLKFAAGRATRRLKESVWHPLEDVDDTDDGGCKWTAPIDDWREMLPWIRGWGADCEVLEPEPLRNKIIGEVRRMARLYDLSLTKTKLSQPSIIPEPEKSEPMIDIDADHLITNDGPTSAEEIPDELGELFQQYMQDEN